MEVTMSIGSLSRPPLSDSLKTHEDYGFLRASSFVFRSRGAIGVREGKKKEKRSAVVVEAKGKKRMQSMQFQRLPPPPLPKIEDDGNPKFVIVIRTANTHGELDTRTGAPSYLALIIRRFYPELSANIGVGLQSDKRDKLGYYVRGKKAISLTSNGFMGVNIKGRCDTDKEFRERRAKGALELVWSILDFQKDQDVRIKVGYEISEKVLYFQVRENNWTLNANGNGKWNIRFDL